ncbi:MAG: TetR family transcriptional regulator [Hyphomicrobiales bacterium]|nr:TetR family transcriptional regulator [Hyphomicrobiales bacterium]
MADHEPLIAKGKKLLIQAALRLAVHTRSIRALGVRELGREAGLNPNTFYRHFKGMDDLGLALIESVVAELRQPLRDMRRTVAQSLAPIHSGEEDEFALNLKRTRAAKKETIKLFFDFVEANPEAFIIGLSELNGSSPRLREALREAIAGFAADMAEDFRLLGLTPVLDDESVQQVSTIIIRNMFYMTTEYIERPERRAALLEAADKLVRTLLIGALARRVSDPPRLLQIVAVLGVDAAPQDAR